MSRVYFDPRPRKMRMRPRAALAVAAVVVQRIAQDQGNEDLRSLFPFVGLVRSYTVGSKNARLSTRRKSKQDRDRLERTRTRTSASSGSTSTPTSARINRSSEEESAEVVEGRPADENDVPVLLATPEAGSKGNLFQPNARPPSSSSELGSTSSGGEELHQAEQGNAIIAGRHEKRGDVEAVAEAKEKVTSNPAVTSRPATRTPDVAVRTDSTTTEDLHRRPSSTMQQQERRGLDHTENNYDGGGRTVALQQQTRGTTRISPTTSISSGSSTSLSNKQKFLETISTSSIRKKSRRQEVRQSGLAGTHARGRGSKSSTVVLRRWSTSGRELLQHGVVLGEEADSTTAGSRPTTTSSDDERSSSSTTTSARTKRDQEDIGGSGSAGSNDLEVPKYNDHVDHDRVSVLQEPTEQQVEDKDKDNQLESSFGGEQKNTTAAAGTYFSEMLFHLRYGEPLVAGPANVTATPSEVVDQSEQLESEPDIMAVDDDEEENQNANSSFLAAYFPTVLSSFLENISDTASSFATKMTRKRDPDERSVRILSERSTLRRTVIPSIFHDETKFIEHGKFRSLLRMQKANRERLEAKRRAKKTGKIVNAATSMRADEDPAEQAEKEIQIQQEPTTRPAAATTTEQGDTSSTSGSLPTSTSAEEELQDSRSDASIVKELESVEVVELSNKTVETKISDSRYPSADVAAPVGHRLLMSSSSSPADDEHGESDEHGDEHAHAVNYLATHKDCTIDEELDTGEECSEAGEFLFGIPANKMEQGNIAIQVDGIQVGPNRPGCYYERQQSGTKRLIWKTGGDTKDKRSNTGTFLFVCKVYHPPPDFPDSHIVQLRYPMIFVMLTLFVSVLVSYIGRATHDFFPMSLWLVLFGILTDLIASQCGSKSYFGRIADDIQHVDPHIIFWVLLPPLLYEDGSGADWRVLRPLVVNALILAVPGVIISFSLMGVLIRYTLRMPSLSDLHQQHIVQCTCSASSACEYTEGDNRGELTPEAAFSYAYTTEDGTKGLIDCVDRSGGPSKWIAKPEVFGLEGSWPWSTSMLLGAILSATDPVAVIAALKALGAPARLTLLIAGEALLNDATGVVFFSVFWANAKDNAEFSFLGAIASFFRLAGGGFVWAFVGAGLMHGALKFTHHMSSKNFLFLTFACVFGLFLVAEQEWFRPVHPWSGVIAVVVFAFYVCAVGEKMILLNGGAHLAHAHHEVVSFVAGLANDIIFFLAGMVIGRFLFYSGMGGADFGFLFVLYAYCHIARGTAIFSLIPLLNMFGFGMNWKEGIIGVLGGLRGAVGLAMALLIVSDASDPPLDLGFRLRIGFHASGIAALTLAINGVIFPYVYNALNIYPPTIQASQTKMLKCATLAEGILYERLAEMRNHWLFCNLNAEHILALVPRIADMLAEEEEKHAAGGHNHDKGHHHHHGQHKDSKGDNHASHGNKTVADRLHHLHHEYHGDAYYFKTFRQVADRHEAKFTWETKKGLTNFLIPAASESFSQRNEDAAAWLHGGFGKDFEMVIHIYYYAMMSALERCKMERQDMAIWPAAEIGEALEFTHEAMQGVLRADKCLTKADNLMIKKFFPKMPDEIWTEDQDTQQLFALEVGFCKLLARLFGRDIDLPWVVRTECCRTVGNLSTDVESASKTLLLYCLLLENTRASLQPILAGGDEDEAAGGGAARVSIGGAALGRKSVALEAIRASMSAASLEPDHDTRKSKRAGGGGGRKSVAGGPSARGVKRAQSDGLDSTASMDSSRKKKKRDKSSRRGFEGEQENKQSLEKQTIAAMMLGRGEDDMVKRAKDKFAHLAHKNQHSSHAKNAYPHAGEGEARNSDDLRERDLEENLSHDGLLVEESIPILLGATTEEDSSGPERGVEMNSNSTSRRVARTPTSTTHGIRNNSSGKIAPPRPPPVSRIRADFGIVQTESGLDVVEVDRRLSMGVSSSSSVEIMPQMRTSVLNTGSSRRDHIVAPQRHEDDEDGDGRHDHRKEVRALRQRAPAAASTTSDHEDHSLDVKIAAARPSTSERSSTSEEASKFSSSSTRRMNIEGRHHMPDRGGGDPDEYEGGRKKKKPLPLGEALNMLDRSLSAVLTAARTTLIKCVFEKFPSQSNIWLHAFVCQGLTQDLYRQLELSEKNGLLLPNELELLNHNVFHAVLHKLAKYSRYATITKNFPDLDMTARQSLLISRNRVLSVDDLQLPIGPVVLANLNREIARKKQTRDVGKRAQRAGVDRKRRKQEMLSADY
ncbi:unnamed protein product [Amoebophrya sp. A120]|nr:unnamed protein product [Amoebophrya sp. A120]|eukprot:GSA120T00022340001.1